MTVSLVELFRQLNRKERHWLVRHALGPRSARLGDDFRSNLAATLNKHRKPISIPSNAEWAIDYHIDWLVALLSLYERKKSGNSDTTFSNTPRDIKGNQQDFDLVVAFDNVLVLIEAKGVGCWSNDQLRSKVSRLNALTKAFQIDKNGQSKSGIQLYFVLCSPLQSERITGLERWPSWATGLGQKPIWMCLTPPDNQTEFLVVTRYSENECWKVVQQAVRLECESGENKTAPSN